uniref:Carboxylic ester hydrolase n=1 Tax=Timema cristinae TaxID=61476 RepID=A0A7R9GVG2_TIMCR|nr:unnamed protein product [Timema cristinae]
MFSPLSPFSGFADHTFPDSKCWVSGAVVKITVEQGVLAGVNTTTRSGKILYEFNGVPYAKPPVGDLRFKLPVDGINPGLPVMVWIHGGAYAVGNGNPRLCSPYLFVDKSVIVVMMNYRLGTLVTLHTLVVSGFLSLNGSDVSPNAGMKDQVAALRWVKQNIAKFGGNPNKVTIFGESAGSASVQYHLLSKMSKVLDYWAFTKSGTSASFELGEHLGLKTSNPQEMADYLRSLPADRVMMAALSNFKMDNPDSIRQSSLTFVPGLEYDVPGEDKFLTDHPFNLLKEGKVNYVPHIIGVNLREGKMFAGDPDEDYWVDLEDDIEKLVPPELGLEKESAESLEVAAKVRRFFFGDSPFNDNAILALIDIVGDLTINVGVYEIAKLLTLSPEPVYFYHFVYEGGFYFMEPLTKMLPMANVEGPTHTDEIGYIFYQPEEIEGSPDDLKVRENLVKLWSNFAKTGVPETGTEVKWTPISASSFPYLSIDTELKMEENFEKENMQLWNEIGYHSVDNRLNKEEVSPHLLGRRVENYFEKATSSSPERDSNLDLPVLGGLVQHETSALVNYATKAANDSSPFAQVGVTVMEGSHVFAAGGTTVVTGNLYQWRT